MFYANNTTSYKDFTLIFTFYNIKLSLSIIISRHFLHFLKRATSDSTPFKIATSHLVLVHMWRPNNITLALDGRVLTPP